jgi:single-strand DNA-binding protein
VKEGLNRWTGIGNLGADPELRATNSGTSVLKLRMACTESYLDKDNTRKERTEWVSVTVWGKRAEGLSKFLAKGHTVYVEGRLQTSSYEKDGEKRYRTEIVATDVKVFGGAGGGSGSGERQRTERRPPPAAPRGNAPPSDDYGDDYGDDIPF